MAEEYDMRSDTAPEINSQDLADHCCRPEDPQVTTTRDSPKEKRRK